MNSWSIVYSAIALIERNDGYGILDIYVPNLKEISEPISIIVENCHVHQNDSGASTKMPKLAVHISDKEIEA